MVRTPEDRFEGLADYSFEPNYVSVHARGVEALRMHFVDAGPRQSPVVLLLHGQPTWSYLYRKAIGVLTDRGLRAVAPDNIGFGRSDKLTEPTAYTYRRHVEWMTSFVEALDLREVTLVVQDWGGPIGLGALAAVPERFARVVAANTVLHTCDPALEGKVTWANHATGDGRVVLAQPLVEYVQYCQRAPELVASNFVYATAGALPAAVLAGYDAPFPDQSFTAGMRQMTALIPLTPTDPGARMGVATMETLEQWERPFLTAFSDGDPATADWDTVFQERVPGAAGQVHPIIRGAGHFLPEERGEELGSSPNSSRGAQARLERHHPGIRIRRRVAVSPTGGVAGLPRALRAGRVAELTTAKLVLPTLKLSLQHAQTGPLLALADDGMQMVESGDVDRRHCGPVASRSAPIDADDPATLDPGPAEAQPQDRAEVEEHKDDDEPRDLREVANECVVCGEHVVQAVDPNKDNRNPDNASDDLRHGLHLLSARCSGPRTAHRSVRGDRLPWALPVRLGLCSPRPRRMPPAG